MVSSVIRAPSPVMRVLSLLGAGVTEEKQVSSSFLRTHAPQ